MKFLFLLTEKIAAQLLGLVVVAIAVIHLMIYTSDHRSYFRLFERLFERLVW